MMIAAGQVSVLTPVQHFKSYGVLKSYIFAEVFAF